MVQSHADENRGKDGQEGNHADENERPLAVDDDGYRCTVPVWARDDAEYITAARCIPGHAERAGWPVAFAPRKSVALTRTTESRRAAVSSSSFV